MIAVFAYDFPHRKSHDFLLEMVAQGHRDLCVIAAPWKPLPFGDKAVHLPRSLQVAPPRNTRDLCAAIGLTYLAIDHGDAAAIEALRDEYRFKVGVIAGARIIRRSVIELFETGIVNFHPGKLPETSGLDAFYYSIANNIPIGVTSHYIDSRVDAGEFILFEELIFGPDDSIEAVQENMYKNQLIALRRFLDMYRQGSVISSAIDRPNKNVPMSKEEKLSALKQFPTWRNYQYILQRTNSLFNACEHGDHKYVEALARDFPNLIEQRNDKGWTPLIVAAYNGRVEAASALLKLGADPNAAGRNGTTPLMYAKSQMVGDPDLDFAMLDLLIEHGAEVKRTDIHGRDVLSYILEAGDERLIAYFTSRTDHSR